jgi:hypothetical protein
MGKKVDVEQNPGGILIRVAGVSDLAATRKDFLNQAVKLGIDQLIEATEVADGQAIRFRLHPAVQQVLAPACDTLQLSETLNLNTLASRSDLEKEILLAMLSGPVTFEYPSYTEFAAAVRIRQNIVEAARRTALSFHTHKIERPTDYWTYSRESGLPYCPASRSSRHCAKRPNRKFPVICMPSLATVPANMWFCSALRRNSPIATRIYCIGYSGSGNLKLSCQNSFKVFSCASTAP